MKEQTSWYCDTCGKLISAIEDGWVEWITYKDSNGKSKARDFRLVHGSGKRCQFDEQAEFHKDGGVLSDLPLEHFLGTEGLMLLLCKIDEGEIPTNQLVEMIKRLHIPGYEIDRRDSDSA